MKLSRKLDWISSVDGQNQFRLEALHKSMTTYYSTALTRKNYNSMIAVNEEDGPDGIITASFLKWFAQQSFRTVVVIGCGTGRIFKKLKEDFSDFEYTGIELDSETIENNRRRWSDQTWETLGVYDLKLPAESFDLCFSFYVLEHLVFPEKALNHMYRLIKPGGSLLLVFPDFSATQRFPSQHLGRNSDRSAKSNLKKGRLFDALVFYFDGRRMAKKLRELSKHIGEFLVNTSPVCLFYQHKKVWPDIDAVYLAQKAEIEFWALKNGSTFEYPFGKKTPFDENSFMVIKKPGI